MLKSINLLVVDILQQLVTDTARLLEISIRFWLSLMLFIYPEA